MVKATSKEDYHEQLVQEMKVAYHKQCIEYDATTPDICSAPVVLLSLHGRHRHNNCLVKLKLVWQTMSEQPIAMGCIFHSSILSTLVNTSQEFSTC